MSEWYLPLKLLHILSSTVLFGTGIGTAFSMWRAHVGGDPRAIAATSRSVVLADWLFTTPAVIVQPLTGLAMISILGYPWTAAWLVASYALYVLVGLCWLPVVGLQLRMRRLANAAVERGEPLPGSYHRSFALWFALGWPAFAGVVAIYALMVWKPPLWD
ncbi:MAG: DUF2269 domain-containing protein [Steroidobacteraceae bacterium]|jgi:uncharacterized membrane protein|nr:DUF2269 domain-containing protein [Steroidobacteraceae bacterium]